MPDDNNIEQFAADLDKLAELTGELPADITRMVALDLYAELISRNPVDTGYSRANWRIGIGAPDTTVEPSERPKSGSAVIGAPSPDAALVKSIDGTEIVFITNSVEYVVFLEEGGSQQAPNGFIAISEKLIESKINAYIAEAEAKLGV
jgi:hypothetical protein